MKIRRLFLLMAVLILSVVSGLALASSSHTLMMWSPYSFEQTIERVKKAVEGHNFRVVRERRETVVDKKEEEGQKAYRHHSIYFCNFEMLRGALEKDRRIGYLLPCRITVGQVGNKVLVAAEDPLKLAPALGPDLQDECRTLKAVYVRIIQEATL